MYCYKTMEINLGRQSVKITYRKIVFAEFIPSEGTVLKVFKTETISP